MIKLFEVLMLIFVIIAVVCMVNNTDDERKWCMMLYGMSGILFIIGWVADFITARI